MSKPLPREIPSDDCAVSVDGVTYHPHEGEWVKMFTGMSVGEAQSTAKLAKLAADIQADKDDPAKQAEVAMMMDEHFDVICAALSDRIVAWNWTNKQGKPLPQPDGTPGPLKRLDADELHWLLMAGQGETPGERKNA